MMFGQGDEVIRKSDNKRMVVLQAWEGQREEDGQTVKVPMVTCSYNDNGARFHEDVQVADLSPARELRLVK